MLYMINNDDGKKKFIPIWLSIAKNQSYSKQLASTLIPFGSLRRNPLDYLKLIRSYPTSNMYFILNYCIFFFTNVLKIFLTNIYQSGKCPSGLGMKSCLCVT